MTRSQRRGDIQGLRAIAVVIVVLFHSMGAFPGGFVGVDVFFVISGFVITNSLRNELERSGSIDLGRFYVRRVRRLLPALTAMLAVVLLVSTWLSPIGGLRITVRTGVAAVFFNANNYLALVTKGYFDPSQEHNALLHTWSLSVEEQFYFAFPILLLIGWRISRRSVAGLSVTMVAIAIPSFWLNLKLSAGPPGEQDWAFYLAPARAWEFAVGGLLALAAAHIATHPRLTTRVATALGAAGIGGLTIILFAFDEQTRFPGTAVLYPVVATLAVLIAGIVDPNNPISQALSISPMQWLGDLSYGWYLWHWPAIVMAAAVAPSIPLLRPVGALVAIVPAIISLYLIENPIRLRVAVPGWKTVRLAVVCLGVPLLCASASESSTNRAVDSVTLSAFGPHVDRELGCEVDMLNTDQCSWDNNSDDTVVLIGDSQAGHLVEGLVVAAEEANVNLRVATRGGCPFVDLVIMHGDRADERCADFVDSSLEQLDGLAPSRVILSSASDRYIEETDSYLVDPETGEEAKTAVEKAELWTTAFERTVEKVTSTGIPVSVVHPVPRFGQWDVRGCAYATLKLNADSCATDEPRVAALAFRERAMDAESALNEDDMVRTVDLFDVLCPGTTCRTSDNGRWRNVDSFHITVDQSVALAPALEEAVTVDP